MLSNEAREKLRALVRSRRTSVRLAQRARSVLLAAAGGQNKDIARELGVGRVQVARWRQRYTEAGLAGIERDLPRGVPPVKVDVARLVELTMQDKPEVATHWSTRTMASELGVSAASVSRHWRANGVPSENSIFKPVSGYSCRSSRISVMKATYLGQCDDLTPTARLHLTWFRRVLIEGQMGTATMIVRKVSSQDSAYVRFSQNDYMVKAFTTNRSDEPFDIGILPGRPWRGKNLLYTHTRHAALKVSPVDSITVTEQVFRRRIKWKGLGDLLGCPLSRWTFCHIKMNDSSTVMGKYDEDKKHSKGGCWYCQKVNRN